MPGGDFWLLIAPASSRHWGIVNVAMCDGSVQTVADGIDGGFDVNGFVDAGDLDHPTLGWRARLGVDIDGDDILVWKRNLGAGTPPAAVAAVAEPSTALLALLGIVEAMRGSRLSAGGIRR